MAITAGTPASTNACASPAHCPARLAAVSQAFKTTNRTRRLRSKFARIGAASMSALPH